MKILLLTFAILATAACTTNELIVNVPANQKVELDYPDMALYNVEVKNRSGAEIDVAVLSKENGDQVRGFGLNRRSKAEVIIESENKLTLRNKGNENALVKISIEARNESTLKPAGAYINFTLRNGSPSSIPLIIPGVMNPNLSPFSNSGVSLKIGQEILFKDGGKRYVLLTVDNTIEDGEVVEVAQLLKQRRRELEL